MEKKTDNKYTIQQNVIINNHQNDKNNKNIKIKIGTVVKNVKNVQNKGQFENKNININKIDEPKDIPSEPKYEDDPENYEFYHAEWSMRYGPLSGYQQFTLSNVDNKNFYKNVSNDKNIKNYQICKTADSFRDHTVHSNNINNNYQNKINNNKKRSQVKNRWIDS